MLSPHPLALRLIERLHGRPGSRILEFASGSGRNARALEAAGFQVVALDDAAAAEPEPFAAVDGTFAAALSTHGLLHGTREEIGSHLESLARRLEPGAPLYATFGSVRDARCGAGMRLGPSTYAALDGEERGVPHTYFDDAGLRELIVPHFTIESLAEGPADRKSAIHWFLIGSQKG